MKSLRLSDLRKRSTRYFRSLGRVKVKSKKAADILVKKSLEALPKRLQDFIKPDEARIRQLLQHLMEVADVDDGLDVYAAAKSYAQNQRAKIYSSQKEELWSLFKMQEPQVYNHYNSYVYRLGYSASKYWFENVKFEKTDGSFVNTILKLPPKPSGVAYSILEINYDFSNHFLEAYIY